jgi:ATP-dependent DNA ligase
LLHLDNKNLMSRPLLQRRVQMEDALQHVRAFEFEEVVAKQRDSI